MAKKGKKGSSGLKRDLNIYLNARGEISLSTRTVKNKKAYTRKRKHKKAPSES